MAIALDAVASATAAYSTATAASPATFLHTCTGANLALIAWATGRFGTASNWTAKYNGVSMTRSAINPSGGRPAALFTLLAPATGANTVSVTNDESGDLQINSISYTGVSGIHNVTVGADGSGTTPTVVVSSATGEVVVGCLLSFAFISGNPGSGQTKRWQSTSTASMQGGADAPGATSVTMNWTVSGSGDDNFMIGLALQPSGGGGGGSSLPGPTIVRQAVKRASIYYAPEHPAISLAAYYRERARAQREFLRKVRRAA